MAETQWVFSFAAQRPQQCYTGAAMNAPLIIPIGDNFTYILCEGRDACVIDPGAAEPVLDALRSQHLSLRLILNTHHHSDHTAGNAALVKATACEVMAGHSGQLHDNDTITLGTITLHALATPGHTYDSFCFYIPSHPGMVFTGDTLFIGGCGRLFDGTGEALWHSLHRLAALPDDTQVYCGHDYAADNFAFAVSVEPQNRLFAQRQGEIETRSSSGLPNVPSTIAIEKQTNIFLRAKDMRSFIDLRNRKDRF